jgi:ABC-type Zn uptake system ZnuABC Zn-binding protein ZnuA
MSNFVKTIAKELLPRFEDNQQKNKEQLDVFISGLNQVLDKEVVIN